MVGGGQLVQTDRTILETFELLRYVNVTKENITGFGSVAMAMRYVISAGENQPSPAVQHAGITVTITHNYSHYIA